MKRKSRTYDRERHNKRAIRIQNTLTTTSIILLVLGIILAIGTEGPMINGTDTVGTHIALGISIVSILLSAGIQGFLSWAVE